MSEEQNEEIAPDPGYDPRAARLPWDRQDNESTQAFTAFVAYRDLGGRRTMPRAYELHTGKSLKGKAVPGRWRHWAAAYTWTERCKAYDRAIDTRARAATEQDAIELRRTMLRAHADDARGILGIARAIMKEFQERYMAGMSPLSEREFVALVRQTPSMLEMGHKLERLAVGELPENIAPPKRIEDMTDQELDRYIEQLQSSSTP